MQIPKLNANSINGYWYLVLATLMICLASSGCKTWGSGKSKKPGDSLLTRIKNPNKTLPKPDDVLDPLGARDANRLVLQDLAPGQVATTIKSRFAKGNNSTAAQAAYDKGQDLYTRGLEIRSAKPDGDDHIEVFEDAAKQFRLASSQWKDSALEQDALFFEGESYFFANRYVQSNRAFEKLIAAYSGTRYLDMAEARRFAISQYWLGLARSNKKAFIRFPHPDASRPTFNLAGESRRILNRIRIDDPTGKLADDATMALANAFFEAELYQEAADAYGDLRQSYPGTPHLFQAHLFELKSHIKSYYGNSYDLEPLRKADELLRQIVRQFPQESAEEEVYLSKEASAIRNMLAERDFTLGKYYENRGENRAASIMYEQVAKNYSDTELGMKVDERIATLSGKQPLPTQQAQWFVDLFPKSDNGRPMIASGSKDSIFR